MTATEPVTSTATLSDDGRYRYDLTRRWRDGDLMLWIMLNPSTADAERDDPTIRRCVGYARREDCAGIAVVNLYAYRATQPDDLRRVDDPIGSENQATICRWLASPEVSVAVAGWGAWRTAQPWDRRLSRLIVESFAEQAGRELVCLGRTRDGSPRHPLMVSRHEPLVAFEGIAP